MEMLLAGARKLHHYMKYPVWHKLRFRVVRGVFYYIHSSTFVKITSIRSAFEKGSLNSRVSVS